MANALYPNFKNRILTKQIDMSTDSIQAVLVNNSYTFSNAHLTYAASVAANAIGSPVALANKVVSVDTFDADDTTFPAVTSGANIKAVVLYHQTSGVLIAYIDTGAGLPATGNGGDIQINWSNAATKIFQL